MIEFRQVRPTQLFIAADGPRSGNSEDIALCEETRNITSLVDWECDVNGQLNPILNLIQWQIS
ncbi:MAG: hypothetical protein V3V14_11660 [Saprospiraceae bacterium]